MVAGVVDKMKTQKCSLCHEEISSKEGLECKMCGMPLNDKGRDFCSKICRIKYNELKKTGKHSQVRAIAEV